MTEKYDPRAPRPNPELQDIYRAMGATFKLFQAATSFSEIRGHALVLQAHIEALLEEPETLLDLAPGPVVMAKAVPGSPGQEGAWDPDGESPFDRPGSDRGRYFFYTYSGGVTPLFREGEPQADPYRMSGYWVLKLEKRHACLTETTMHLTSEEALERIRPQLKKMESGEKKGYYLLMDPKGIYNGASARSLGVVPDLKQAIGIADRLGEWLDIRFVVGALIARIDTH